VQGEGGIETTTQSNQSMRTVRVTCISIDPFILEIDNFMSSDECATIMSQAEPTLQCSHVMGKESTSAVNNSSIPNQENANSISDSSVPTITNKFRSSTNTWLPLTDNLVDLQTRIRHLLGTTQIQFEDLQVVRYEAGQEFQLHHDSSAFHPRSFTCLIYLNDVDASAGGGTHFPLASINSGSSSSSTHSSSSHESTGSTKNNQMTNIENVENAIRSVLNHDSKMNSQLGVTVKPVVGKCVVFFNHNIQNGNIDPNAIHSGELLISGQKWVANYWGNFLL
jgi:hypothetical protein